MAHPRRSPEEIERGLTALILAGSSFKASEACGIPPSTLRDWKKDHAEQYERLCNDLEPRIVKKIAAEAEGIVIRLAAIQHDVLDQFEETKHDLKPAELAAASRNLATTSALYVDKHSSPLRERPSHVQQGHDIEGLMMRAARALGVQHVANRAAIEGTVNDESPAESEAFLEVTLNTGSGLQDVRRHRPSPDPILGRELLGLADDEPETVTQPLDLSPQRLDLSTHHEPS